MKMKIDARKLEELLKKEAKEGRFNPELSDDVVDFLLEISTPVQPSENLLDELQAIIVNAIQERQRTEATELQKSTTFGEYFKKLKDRIMAMSSLSMTELIPSSITPEKIKYLERDQIRKLSAGDVAEVIMHFGMPYERASALLRGSFKVESLKEQKLFAASNARVSEDLNSEARYEATMSSMQKLLLAVDSERKLTNIDQEWQSFKAQLEKGLKAAKYI